MRIRYRLRQLKAFTGFFLRNPGFVSVVVLFIPIAIWRFFQGGEKENE